MSKLFDLLHTLIGKVNAAVKTEAQILTAEQKAQARANIGAAEEGSGGGSGVQGNLEQNDPTQPDYIKGRTHWVEGEPLLLRQAEFGLLHQSWHPDQVLYPGKSYLAVWNGVEYDCVAQKYVLLGITCCRISTPAFTAIELYDSDPTAASKPWGFTAMGNDGSLSATLALYEDTRTVHKLHHKFLPDGVPYSGGWTTVDVLPELTAEFTQGALTGAGEVILPSVLDLVEGETYTVTWDGTIYECVCKHLAGNFGGTYMESLILGNASVFGDYDTGEPFIIGNMLQPMILGMAISIFDYSTHTVKVEVNKETVHKLDNKYLDLAWLPTVNEDNEIVAGTVVTGDTAGLGGKGGFLDGFGYENHDLYNGRKFNVYFDGVPYTTSVLNFYDPTDIAIYAGNLGLVNHEAPNTGEPFVIQFQSDDAFFLWVDGAESHTVSIFDLVPNRMPAEFLPDDATFFRLTSPNGTKYVLTVGDDGTLRVTPA